MQVYRIVDPEAYRFEEQGVLISSDVIPRSNPPLNQYAIRFSDGETEAFLAHQIYKEELRTCLECGKSDETVYFLACGYAEEIHDAQVWEVICLECENGHLMDI